ncbi:MAG TPA: alpha/beta hydrolase-fold protein [Streptosporangiaceae bacterium]|nr:alpha/beta hydrolase-fold protein [Streptosporangiaceae bacterium]
MTSGAFEVLMTCVAIAGLAAVVWAWPRAGGHSGRHLAGRAGLLVGSQLLVVTAFLAGLNGYFGFIGSWSQLFGAGRQPIAASGPGRASAGEPASSAPSFRVTGVQPGPAPHGRLLTARTPGPEAGAGRPARTRPGSARPGNGGQRGAPGPAVTGRLVQVSMTGPRTGITVRGDYVYLPPQYFQPAYARARFPVVLALTGYPGSAWTLAARLGLPAEAAGLVAAGRLPPAVYVLMGSGPALPRDTECTNIPAGPQVETFFAQDVPRLIEQHFRVQAGASGWAALGYSTGGYCAAKLAMLNPYQFRSAVSVAGYYVALRDATTGNLYGGSLAYRHENDLDWRLRHLPAPPVSLLVTSSKVGEDTYPGTLAFLRLARPPMRVYSLILPEGGHNYGTWRRELPQCLAWLGPRITPPAQGRDPG